MTNPKESGARTEVGPHITIDVAMEDLPKAERRALEKELEEEMAQVRRKKLACFQKTRRGVIKKTVLAVMTMAIATSTVTPNLTPEELVKFMDVAVASKYRNNLTNFTCTITEEVRSTLDTFKTDLQNMLPRQIRSVVQQVQGESQGKQPVAEPSTPYPGSTSAPGNTSMVYPGNTTTPGNPGNTASTSTSHPGNTSGNLIYVDTSSPYPGGVSMGNLGTSPTANLPYPGGASTAGNLEFPAHTTPTNPNPNFQQPYYQTMAYGPNIPPMGMGVTHSPIPDILFPRTPAYVTPNLRVEGEVNDGVRDHIARTLREFGCTSKGRARSYQKPYLEYFDMIPYPWGFWVPDLAKFTGDDAKTTYEHIGQFLAQVNDVGITDVQKIRMFPLSLTGTAFNWFTSLPPNSIDSWVSFEQKFHDYFYNREVELRLPDLTSLRQKYTETISDYLRWFREVRNRCYILTIAEKIGQSSFCGFETISQG
jgi:hypothetical protein